jgi:predicted adenylyl cyclase CyaB
MSDPRRNVELKAWLPAIDAARVVARELSGEPPTIQRQVDTYFNCPEGRLKLREIEGAAAQLIFYRRPNRAEARLSQYRLTPVADAEAIKCLLADAIGLKKTVSKTREIYFYRNVRIHIDQIESLGAFLEFEAVLADDMSVADGETIVAELRQRFDIQPGDLIDSSYAELA